MTHLDVMLKLSNVEPPLQPALLSNTHSYHQSLLNWNPTCIKNQALFYQFTTNAEGECDLTFFPDACMKVIFKCNKNSPSSVVSGINSERTVLNLSPNTTYFVFMPYSFAGLKNFKIASHELVNHCVDFSDALPGDAIIRQIAESSDFNDRINLFKSYANQYLINDEYSTGLVEYCAIMMCISRGMEKINNVDIDLGYSERYCRAEFKKIYGISPKRYSRILRFQNTLHMLYEQKIEDISDIVFDNGYFDQTHFIKDFKYFTSETPTGFNNHYAP